MSTERNQSAIAEVRDQLFLDYADGEYLNVVGQNLGVNRPVFGFDDDEWRALVKAIALQYKQVRTRFAAVLAILFGPRVTQVGTLNADIEANATSFTVNDASNFPQVGTVVLDEGLGTEETLTYCFVDYRNNEIYLEDSTTFAHNITEGKDAESSLIVVDSAGTKLIVTDARDFPTSGFPYPAVVGRGTANEEVVEITAVDPEEGSITISTALVNTHNYLEPSVIQNRLDLPYGYFSSFITLEETKQFGASGNVKIDVKTDEFVATAGTVNDVTVAAGTFSANVHTGMYVRFADDTATVALQGVEIDVTSNTSTVLTFGSPLGTAPSAGDTFVLIQPPFNATAGTVNDVTVNSGTFTTDFQVGNRIIFDGNVTSALAGVQVDIVANTDSVLTFASALGTAPVSGDTFRVSPRVSFTSNNTTDNVLTLLYPIRDLVIPEGAIVEHLRQNSTVALSPVKVGGAGWDIFAVTPRELEIYLPEDLREAGTLRSASYIHGAEITPAPATTLAAGGATAGDSFINVVDSEDFPLVGVVSIDLAGTNERVGYYRDDVSATGDITHTGATILDAETFVLDDGTNPAVTFEFDDDDSVVQSFTLRKVDITGLTTDNEFRDAIIAAINNAPLLTITATAGTSAAGVVNLVNTVGGVDGNVAITETVVDGSFVVTGMTGGVDRLSIATQTLANSFLAGDTVDLFQPVHSGTTVLIGDEATQADTFPGPYVYDLDSPIYTATVALTTLDSLVSGPTKVVISTVPTRTALEVEDATAFDLVNLPFNILVGRDTGNRETLTVSDVNLKQRVSSTVSTTIVTADTVNTVDVASLGPGGTDGADFPNSNGYRIIIDRGGANEEVCYVVGTISATNTLVLESNTARTHTIGETVELMADVLSVNSITDTHFGKIDALQRSSAITGLSPHLARWPTYGSPNVEAAETVEPFISSLEVASTAGLDPDGGRVVLNPGNALTEVSEALTVDLAAGGTVITVASSTDFPTTYPFVVTLSAGTPREERALCTNNNGAGQLTINSGTYGSQFAHAVADRSTVSWTPGSEEIIDYDEASGTTLSFSSPIVLQSTHSPSESVVDSSTDSVPRVNGYDFPLRMPVDIRTRIEFLWDLIRAAGIQVNIIDKR